MLILLTVAAPLKADSTDAIGTEPLLSQESGASEFVTVDCLTIVPRGIISHKERQRMMFPETPCELETSVIDTLVENILKTQRFETATWELTTEDCGKQLLLTLVPKPFIRTFSFHGNHQISDARLERASDLRKFQPYSHETLKHSLIQLRDHYLTSGFPMVQFDSSVTGPASDGGMNVTIHVRELPLPKAESLEYRITGYPGAWWQMRIKSVFGWFRWKSRRNGLNMEALRKLARREERILRESGYRNAVIDIHQEPGSVDNHPRILIEIMVDRPVKLKFENVQLLTRRDIVHKWKRKHVAMDEKQLKRLVDQTHDRLVKDGWLDAKVTSLMEETKKRIIAHIVADKGVRRHISTVKLEGRVPVEQDEVGKITGLHKPRLLGAWKTRPGPKTLENAEKAMKTHLENLGYPRPQCSIDTQERVPGAVDVTVEAESGAHRTLGTITFTGAHKLEHDELLKVAALESGRPFVRRSLKNAMTAMTRYYWKHGYADVSMQARTRREENVVDVTFTVEEGPRYLQGPMILNGNVKTRSNLVYRLKRILPGDPFDMEKLGRWQEALYRTGVFESVSIRTTAHPHDDPPSQTVVMEMVERSTGHFETGVDFNTDRGIDFILEIGERNLFGQALNGRLSGLVGQNRWLGSISLGRPVFFGYPLENRLRAIISDDRTNSSYSLRNYELELSTIWHWKNDVSLNMTYAYEREDVRDIDPDVADEIDIENTRSASLTPILTIDHRDDPFRTTRGWFYRTRLKGSFDKLGSDAEFLRWDHDFRIFQPINTDEDVILCGAFRAGRSWTLGNSILPAGERFFLGGASTNRGFEHNECGPQTTDGDALGGLSYLLANLELRFHLAGRLHGALFVDAGNVFEDTAEAPYLRPSAGVGLRLETPIGPFRADLGINLNPENDEPDYVMQFALGHAF